MAKVVAAAAAGVPPHVQLRVQALLLEVRGELGLVHPEEFGQGCYLAKKAVVVLVEGGYENVPTDGGVG